MVLRKLLILILFPLAACGQSVDGGLKTLVASGTNTYTIPEPLPAVYTTNERFLVRFTNGNTGAATLNRNSLGAKALQFSGAVALASGDLKAGDTRIVSYNGTYYQIADTHPFSSTGSGIVPSSGGGTTNFLRADGSWALPPGISNSALNNELAMSNGTNVVSSGLFGDAAGDLNLGSSSISGGTRTIATAGSASLIDLAFASKSGNFTFAQVGGGNPTIQPASGTTGMSLYGGFSGSIGALTLGSTLTSSQLINLQFTTSTSSLTGNGVFTLTLSHLVGQGGPPAIAAGVGAGTSPTVNITRGSDTGGLISVLTGSSPTAASIIATITFNAAYASAPSVVLIPDNAAAIALGANGGYVNNSETTTTFSFKGTLSATTTYTWKYHCIQ